MDFGIIGNCKSAALIDNKATLIWGCLPNFDSMPVFAQLLDKNAGHFGISPSYEYTTTQNYITGTNILETYFKGDGGEFVVIDYMPRYQSEDKFVHSPEIHRIIRPLTGTPKISFDYRPKLQFSQYKTHTMLTSTSLIASHAYESIYLYSNLALKDVLNHNPVSLTEEIYFVISYHEKVQTPDLAGVLFELKQTEEYWLSWSSHCALPNLYRNETLRSALTLKLMTFNETGAIVAAPTTSLPEILGKNRNWDYRFCWLRDSSMMIEALYRIGHMKEAREFIHFLLDVFENKSNPVQIVYRIDGSSELPEKTLPHLAGYKDSLPVRIGNEAYKMKQNDIYGEMLNVIYLYYFKYASEPFTDEVWTLVKFLADCTLQEWKLPDAGIWEFRGANQHFTFSKVMCWVALDRAIRIAKRINKTDGVSAWVNAADQIKKEVDQYAWNEEVGAYMQAYGSKDLDISVLLMEYYGFIKPTEPRWKQTVDVCNKELVSNGFCFRYKGLDDFGFPENAFLVASFWLADALCSVGRVDEAIQTFEAVVGHSNHVGLLSEDIDPRTKELLGNFPQAYSHMALINTAARLSEV